jgi:molecular chaperone HscB
MSIDLTQDYFGLFGLPLPVAYALDEGALEAAWHELQARVHPDRHAHLSDVEKRRSMQWATRVNEGFRVLRKPLERAQYLLVLAGVDAALETNTAMSPEFLMEQMEWREAVEEAREAAEVSELEGAAQGACSGTRARCNRHLGVQLDEERDYEAAADTVRRLMFIEKLQQEIDDALLALEN